MKKIGWLLILCVLWTAHAYTATAQYNHTTYFRKAKGTLMVRIDPPKTGALNFTRFTFNVTPPTDRRSRFLGEHFYKTTIVTDRFKTFDPSNIVEEKIKRDMAGFGARESADSGRSSLAIHTSVEVFYPDLRGFLWYVSVVKVRLAIWVTLDDSTLFNRKYETLYASDGLDRDWTDGISFTDEYLLADACMGITLRKTLDDFYRDLDKILNPGNDIMVSGTFTDAETNAPLKAVLLMKSERAQFACAGNTTFTATLPGKTDFDFIVNAPGYLTLSRQYAADQLKEDSQHLNFPLERIEVGAIVRLKNVMFYTGTADLMEESYGQLQEIISFLNDNPSIEIELQGHTDIGDSKRNLKLSKERVNRIKSHLVANGISSLRIKGKGYGDTRPLSTTDNTAAHQQNRRVEFVILKK